MQRQLLSPELVGQRLAMDVTLPGGLGLLVPAGAVLGGGDVDALLARGVRHVFLKDEIFPELPERRTVPLEALLQAQAALGEVWRALAGPEDPRLGELLQRLIRSAASIVDALLDQDPDIADVGPWDVGSQDPVEHAVAVSTVAAQIGKGLGMPRERLVRLCLGALLMDVGRPPVEPGPRVLTPVRENVADVLLHPRRGFERVRRLSAVRPTSASVVLEHHERLDGSGYPDGRTWENIYVFARITAVADVFVALGSDRPQRPRFRPAEILRHFHEEAGVSLDREAAEVLLRHVALVPHGAIVRLTDGTLAKVVAHSLGAPLQPLVVVAGNALNQPVGRRQVNLRGTGVYVERILDTWPRELTGRLRGRPAGAERLHG